MTTVSDEKITYSRKRLAGSTARIWPKREDAALVATQPITQVEKVCVSRWCCILYGMHHEVCDL